MESGSHAYIDNPKNNSVKIILRKNNRGLANSINEGIKISQGKYIIVMDTDLTHDPKLIPNLIIVFLSIAKILDFILSKLIFFKSIFFKSIKFTF